MTASVLFFLCAVIVGSRILSERSLNFLFWLFLGLTALNLVVDLYILILKFKLAMM